MATPRLKEKYNNEVRDKLYKELELTNVNQVPRLEKIVVNMGVGRAAGDSKLLDGAIADLRVITGQQPMVTRAKKSIAGFHLREGQAIGAKVTLRDFRGLNPKSFDGRGNYTMGLNEQLIFPEIEYDKVDHTRGMDITFVTTSENNEGAKALLDALGFPFKKNA